MKKNKGESRLVVWDELKRIDDTCFGKITSYIIEAGKSKRYDGRCRNNITEKYYEGETMQQNQWIVDEMNQVYKQGIRVDVNGLSYNPKTSANLMRVLENGSYMLDYEGDMLGRIVALHVDSVGPSEQPSYKTLRCKKTKNRPEKKRRSEKNKKK